MIPSSGMLQCRLACLHACCVAQAHLFWCMLCPSPTTWWHGNAGLHALCLPAPSPGDMEVFCLCSGHIPAWECLSASRSCPALPCSSCSVLQCPCNATYCATIWARLFPSDATWLCRQCGHIYSCAYCVSIMPLGGISIPDCMPSLFEQRHRAE